MSIDINDVPRLSENHAKKLRALKQKKYRDIEKTFLAEGLRLCEEAFSASAQINQVVITSEALQQPRIADLIQKSLGFTIPVFIASDRLFKSLSDEKSPQGILLALAKKSPPAIESMSTRLVLACDNVQDPGNLGTILRSAEWFGVRDILLSAGCVDPYNPKVVRGSMGAIFRLNIFEQVNLLHALPALKMDGYRLIGTALNAAAKLADVPPQKDIVLIGNEANGLSPDVLKLVDVPVSIPGAGHGESLNVAAAAAICLYHFSQT